MNAIGTIVCMFYQSIFFITYSAPCQIQNKIFLAIIALPFVRASFIISILDFDWASWQGGCCLRLAVSLYIIFVNLERSFEGDGVDVGDKDGFDVGDEDGDEDGFDLQFDKNNARSNISASPIDAPII